MFLFYICSHLNRRNVRLLRNIEMTLINLLTDTNKTYQLHLKIPKVDGSLDHIFLVYYKGLDHLVAVDFP